jgi:hypothetical protein
VIIRRPRAGEDLSGAIALLQRFFREEGFDTPDSVIAKIARRESKLVSSSWRKPETKR